MPIIASELKYFESTNNLGGSLVAVEILDDTLHNLFDVVETAGAEAGEINYRCIYIKNTNASLTLANASVYINAATGATKTDLGLGLGTSAVNGVEQTIATELVAPVGVTFTEVVGAGFALVIGDMPPESTKAIWLRRTVTGDAPSTSNDSGSIAIQGDTA